MFRQASEGFLTPQGVKLHQKLFSILLRENHINIGKPYFSAQGLVVKLFGDNCIYLPSPEYVPGLL